LWYASQRQRRFARFLWGAGPVPSPSPVDPGLCRPMSFDWTSEEPDGESLPMFIEA
jgi:hypothetical protein